MYKCIQVHIHVQYTYVWKPEADMGCLPLLPSTLEFDTESLSKHGVYWLDYWLVNELQDRSCLCPIGTPIVLWLHVYCHSWLYMIAEDPKSSPHAGPKSTVWKTTFPVSDSGLYHVSLGSDLDSILLSPLGFQLSLQDLCSYYWLSDSLLSPFYYVEFLVLLFIVCWFWVLSCYLVQN